ncbi:MAG: hypothetical protein FWC26_15475 [Fibromonadales bacterium]|nr:hypothetical protein [Fibromonadales bacterium]
MTKRLLPFVFLYSLVFAYDDNNKVFVYIHHTSLILTSVAKEPFIYLTVEYPLNWSYSIIINPSFIYSKNLGAMADDETKSSYYSRIGSGVGIRRFINDKTDGFYLQLMPGVYRFKNDFTSGIIIDILGYVGYSFKSHMGGIFIDLGVGIVGYGWDSLPRDDAPFWALGGSSGSSFRSVDVNFGFGFAF